MTRVPSLNNERVLRALRRNGWVVVRQRAICRAIALAVLLYSSVLVEAQNLEVTLLGTGTPAPSMDRFGPSILVKAGTAWFLFDCGRGAARRLFQIGVPLSEVHALLLTHLHSDHTVGVPDFWLRGWQVGQRKVPLQVWGPKGTAEMMEHLESAYAADIRFRLASGRRSPQGAVILAQDISEGPVVERNGVKVTAFDVDHGYVKPAFGYRIDYGGRSVVLSGDTLPSENLVRFATGADLLIHEVRMGDTPTRIHATPQQADESEVVSPSKYPYESGRKTWEKSLKSLLKSIAFPSTCLTLIFNSTTFWSRTMNHCFFTPVTMQPFPKCVTGWPR